MAPSNRYSTSMRLKIELQAKKEETGGASELVGLPEYKARKDGNGGPEIMAPKRESQVKIEGHGYGIGGIVSGGSAILNDQGGRDRGGMAAPLRPVNASTSVCGDCERKGHKVKMCIEQLEPVDPNWQIAACGLYNRRRCTNRKCKSGGRKKHLEVAMKQEKVLNLDMKPCKPMMTNARDPRVIVGLNDIPDDKTPWAPAKALAVQKANPEYWLTHIYMKGGVREALEPGEARKGQFIHLENFEDPRGEYGSLAADREWADEDVKWRPGDRRDHNDRHRRRSRSRSPTRRETQNYRDCSKSGNQARNRHDSRRGDRNRGGRPKGHSGKNNQEDRNSSRNAAGKSWGRSRGTARQRSYRDH